MNCPNCGKMLELHEKQFCTGCGAELDWAAIRKKNKKVIGSNLPYGMRVVVSDVEMEARIKGMIFGMICFFVAVFYYTNIINYVIVPKAIGYGIFFSFFGGIFGMFVAARLPDNIKSQIAGSFRFIPTEGTLYHIVDFMFLRFSFLEPKSEKRKPRKNKKVK